MPVQSGTAHNTEHRAQGTLPPPTAEAQALWNKDIHKHLSSYQWKTEVSKQLPKVWNGVQSHLQDDKEANKFDP